LDIKPPTVEQTLGALPRRQSVYNELDRRGLDEHLEISNARYLARKAGFSYPQKMPIYETPFQNQK
jgi:hypothetical protein